MHGGKTYEHTKNKFGKKRADKQAIAIALDQKRKSEERMSHYEYEKKKKMCR